MKRVCYARLLLCAPECPPLPVHAGEEEAIEEKNGKRRQKILFFHTGKSFTFWPVLNMPNINISR